MPTEERQAEIQMEEAIENRPRTPDRDDDERSYRKGIRRDAKRLKAAGIEMIVPSEWPERND